MAEMGTDGINSQVTGEGLVGVGVIGCGGMGSWHAGNVASHGGLSVVAAADAVPVAAAAVAERFGGRVLESYELIEAADVHAVVIASTDETHAEFAVAAIKAGKPCFLEKPLGTTMEHAQQVLDAEVAAGRRLVRVGFMRELDPAHVQVANALAELGSVTRVRSVHRNVDATKRPLDLIFSQSLIHDIHTIRWLFGDEIVGVRSHVVEREDGFRDIHLVCHLSGGGLGLVDFEDQAFGYEVQVEASAANGMVSTLAHPRAVIKQNGNERFEIGTDWFGRFEAAYRIEINEWAATLAGGEPRGPTVWDGYVAQAVADAAQRSIRTGQDESVNLPECPALYL